MAWNCYNELMDRQISLYRNRWHAEQDSMSLARYLRALVRGGMDYKVVNRETVIELLYLPILRRHLFEALEMELLPKNKNGFMPLPSVQVISAQDVRIHLSIVTSREELPELREFLREMVEAMNEELETNPLQQFLRTTPPEQWGPRVREGVGFFLDFPENPDLTTRNALSFRSQVMPLWTRDEGKAIITLYINTPTFDD